MKVALVYDHVNKIGGAERILVALHKLFSDAPIFTFVYNSKKATWAKNIKVIPSNFNNLPFASPFHELYPVLPIFSFESLDLSEYDLVISVTSSEAKAIITHPHQLHICYCLTPTRFLWSHYSDYFNNTWFKWLTFPIVTFLRNWDFIASQRPDVYAGISQTVVDRIKKYYRREADLIYPPVNVNKFQIANSRIQTGKNYFLIVSRLVKYKKIDLVIGACNELGLPLKIVGTGLDEKRLKKIAGKTVKFIGNVDEEKLVEIYQNAKALIFPQEEDFGISAVEALACGVPVVAYQKGGATEYIQLGINGEFFSDQTVESLKMALQAFIKKTYNKKTCRQTALKYSQENFQRNIKKFIYKQWEEFKS